MSKKTFECTNRAQANLIVQVKNNQAALSQQIVHGCKISQPIACHEEDWDKAHGRLEKRIYEVFDPAVFLKNGQNGGQLYVLFVLHAFDNQPIV